jgi:hypothetical protein
MLGAHVGPMDVSGSGWGESSYITSMGIVEIRAQMDHTYKTNNIK